MERFGLQGKNLSGHHAVCFIVSVCCASTKFLASFLLWLAAAGAEAWKLCVEPCACKCQPLSLSQFQVYKIFILFCHLYSTRCTLLLNGPAFTCYWGLFISTSHGIVSPKLYTLPQLTRSPGTHRSSVAFVIPLFFQDYTLYVARLRQSLAGGTLPGRCCFSTAMSMF